MTDDVALNEQLEYYRARAHEYDQWWYRKGRYDRGVEANDRWFAESAEVLSAFDTFQPSGHVLELACGTGIWSERLLSFASRLVVVDGSSEMLERFSEFWSLVSRCLAPGGRVFFVDSRHEPTSTAVDHRLPGSEAITLRRRLNDGREFQIYKIFYDSPELEARLNALGWDVKVMTTARYFIYGQGHLKGA